MPDSIRVDRQDREWSFTRTLNSPKSRIECVVLESVQAHATATFIIAPRIRRRASLTDHCRIVTHYLRTECTRGATRHRPRSQARFVFGTYLRRSGLFPTQPRGVDDRQQVISQFSSEIAVSSSIMSSTRAAPPSLAPV